MKLGIEGKRALVQGASSGLGRAIAAALAAEGVRVALCARREDKLREAVVDTGAEAYVVADLSAPNAPTSVVRDAQDKLGGSLDILVVNTGGPPKGSIEDVSSSQWRQSFESLWIGATESMQAVIPSMKSQRWGRILLVTSISARESITGLTISNSLRAGLLGLTRTASRELAPHGITVNSLLPGYTRTERLRELAVDESAIATQIPAGRLGEPEEFAALAAFLSSQQAAYVNGQSIACDGAYLHGL